MNHAAITLAQAGGESLPDLVSLIGSPMAAVATATAIGSLALKGRIPGKMLPMSTGLIAIGLLGFAWGIGVWAPDSVTVDGLSMPLIAIAMLIGPAGLFEFLRATPLPVGNDSPPAESPRNAGNVTLSGLLLCSILSVAVLATLGCTPAAGGKTEAERSYFRLTAESAARVSDAAESDPDLPSAYKLYFRAERERKAAQADWALGLSPLPGTNLADPTESR